MKLSTERLISVARGQTPADLILANARIVNVFTGEIETGDVAIVDGFVAGIGDYSQAKKVIDLQWDFVLPGFINGHVHIESSMLDVPQYARAVVAHGTTGLVTDLHEIANVSGLDGITYVLEKAQNLPLDLFLMAPSCVPATHLETSGATIGIKEIEQLLKLLQCRGLGEMMNYPGVLFADKNVLGKITAAEEKTVDGHAPGLSGKELNAYIAAGISSDHESVILSEAREKLRRGMHLMIREGSSEKNLETLMPLVTDETYPRCMFVVDDRSCVDLLKDGDIDAVVRKAITLGLNPVRAIKMATINPANYFRLKRTGAITPGYYANLIITNNLFKLPIDKVLYHGKIVAENGQSNFNIAAVSMEQLKHSVNLKSLTLADLRLKPRGELFPVVEIVPGQIITRKKLMKVAVSNGLVQADIKQDILKLVVVERHRATGNVGIGLVTGFGLKNGALASTVAHDSHNIIVVGTNDKDILVAIKALDKMQGGLVVVSDKIITKLPLPVAGLLSDKALRDVVAALENVEKAAASLGVKVNSPFATLSFLALPVIPELRVTDLGIVDVKEFRLI
jgi:adenine deaminase